MNSCPLYLQTKSLPKYSPNTSDVIQIYESHVGPNTVPLSNERCVTLPHMGPGCF